MSTDHRNQEFLGFLHHIEKPVPEELVDHLIADNYCSHKHTKVRLWLAQRQRFHVHYTPTYANLLNQVELWLGIIALWNFLRGSFSSVKELVARVEQFVATCHKTKSPFNWSATADCILEKLQMLYSQISGIPHYFFL